MSLLPLPKGYYTEQVKKSKRFTSPCTGCCFDKNTIIADKNCKDFSTKFNCQKGQFIFKEAK